MKMAVCVVFAMFFGTILAGIYITVNPDVKLAGRVNALEEVDKTIAKGVNKMNAELKGNDQFLQKKIEEGDAELNRGINMAMKACESKYDGIDPLPFGMGMWVTNTAGDVSDD